MNLYGFGSSCHSYLTRGVRGGACARVQRTFLALLLPLLACAPQSNAQSYPPPGMAGAPGVVQPFPPVDQANPVITEKRIDQINAARQKSIVAETNKLLKLATELNAEVRRANRSSLTREELQKVAEIQKLARSVKQKMAMGVNLAMPSPNFSPPPLIPPPNAF